MNKTDTGLGLGLAAALLFFLGPFFWIVTTSLKGNEDFIGRAACAAIAGKPLAKMLAGFTTEPAVLAVSGDYLRVISWNYVANGLLFTCSGMFQALGNTVPSLATSAVRLLVAVVPSLLLATRAGFGAAASLARVTGSSSHRRPRGEPGGALHGGAGRGRIADP